MVGYHALKEPFGIGEGSPPLPCKLPSAPALLDDAHDIKTRGAVHRGPKEFHSCLCSMTVEGHMHICMDGIHTAEHRCQWEPRQVVQVVPR